MDARHGGLVLLLAGLGALWLLGQVLPSPASWEQWVCCDGPPSHLLAGRGPAVGRYDPATGATDVVLSCAHAWCPLAAHVRGNVTDRLGRGSFLFWTGSWPPHPDARAIPGVPVGPSTSATTDVNATTAITFSLLPAWPVVGAHALAWSAFLAGAALAFRGAWKEAAWAAGVVALVMLLVALGSPLAEGGFLLLPAAALGLVAALLTGLLGRAPRAALLLAVASAALLAAWWDLTPFFPGPPMM
ncbi:MAG: hypothetical protein QOE90_1301 [Thermoplasmata archaeon]|jgi:hypothetical protein|nr:hypothetical protein [Thermoplasmata archaeon]